MDNYRHPMYNRYNRNMDKCIDKLPLAMAYVPFQKWRKVYDAPNGLANGTIFDELKLPWLGYKDYCMMRGDRYDK